MCTLQSLHGRSVRSQLPSAPALVSDGGGHTPVLPTERESPTHFPYLLLSVVLVQRALNPFTSYLKAMKWVQNDSRANEWCMWVPYVHKE